MAKYYNITSETTTTLLAKGGTSSTGNVRSINISNNSVNQANVSLELYDGSTSYNICKNIIIPKGATLLLNEGLSFNIIKYHLRIINTGTAPGLTVILK